MSDNEQRRETVADILAEMRKVKGFSVPYAPSGYNGVWTTDLVEFADRIEAAWKRQEQCYLDQIRDAVNMIGHKRFVAKHPPVGNAAAMRKAMEKLDKLLFVGVDGYVYGQPDMTDEIERTIKSALATPPRNCDVGTVEEQAERFKAYCVGRRCRECPWPRIRSCDLAWAQMPYETAEEGSASPAPSGEQIQETIEKQEGAAHGND